MKLRAIVRERDLQSTCHKVPGADDKLRIDFDLLSNVKQCKARISLVLRRIYYPFSAPYEVQINFVPCTVTLESNLRSVSRQPYKATGKCRKGMYNS